MLNHEFSSYLHSKHSVKIKSIISLSGGDINSVYLLKTNEDSYVLKVNDARTFQDLFKRKLMA